MDRAEQVDFFADGSLRLLIDGKMLGHEPRGIMLTAGEHEVMAEVANPTRFPALFVRGETLVSDDSWTVTRQVG